MKSIDIIIIGLIFFSAIVGFWRGFTREVLGILSWVTASVLTYFLHGMAEPLLGTVISNEFLKEHVSALIVFLISLIILTSITYRFSDAVKASIIGGADKVLGFLFGSFRGLILVSILAFGINKFLLKNSENAPLFFKESKLLPLSDIFITRLIQSIPQARWDKWKEKTENLINDVPLREPQEPSKVIEELPNNRNGENVR